MAELINKQTMKTSKNLHLIYSGRSKDNLGIKITKAKEQYVLILHKDEMSHLIAQLINYIVDDKRIQK